MNKTDLQKAGLSELSAAQTSGESAEQRIAALEAELATFHQAWADPTALHVNLLRHSECANMRAKFLHLAGATDYDETKQERDRLRAEAKDLRDGIHEQRQDNQRLIHEKETLIRMKAKAEAERDELRAQIQAAPHANGCVLISWPDDKAQVCTCWKSAALAKDQAGEKPSKQ